MAEARSACARRTSLLEFSLQRKDGEAEKKTLNFIQFYCCDLNRRRTDRGKCAERQRRRGTEKEYCGWSWTSSEDDARQHQKRCL